MEDKKIDTPTINRDTAPSRGRRRWPLLLGIVFGATVAVVAGTMVSDLLSLRSGPGGPEPVAATEPAANVAPAPAPPHRPAPPAPRTAGTDLFPEGAAYPLERWSLRTATMGFIDDAVLQARAADGSGADGDVLVLNGWAGHTSLGMRLPYVVFAVCGQVIGGVAVALPRPDVAEAVHRNLGQSGWTARIPVGVTPRCADPVLKAYGVGPIGVNAWPLGNDVPLPVDGVSRTATQAALDIAPVITPDTFAAAEFGDLRIKATVANLRQCPSTKCAVVNKRKKGVHKALVIEQSGDWSLIQFQDTAGWLHASLIQKR